MEKGNEENFNEEEVAKLEKEIEEVLIQKNKDGQTGILNLNSRG